MRKLNKLGFIEKGSPYYGWLISIFSTVIRVANQYNINLIFYGENGEVEYGGSSENKDVPLFDTNYMINNLITSGYEKNNKKSKLKKMICIGLIFPSKT